jgi:OOP family OmpA-OmpF porin
VDSAKPERAQPQPRVRVRRGLRARQRTKTEDAGRSLEELRRSIVGPERERIERLEERPPVAPESVGAVLPEAVAAARLREHDLAVALEPSVTDAVTSVAQRRPDLYSEILAPTIGAAVKKAVAEAIAVLLERFNAALERSLSLRSIQWRIEAARTGRPFGEIVLLHTLIYRVEQVFLIHSQTSLVLQHLVDPAIETPAADQIAAMLSAIETFGREAFGPMPPEAHLSRFELGELTVWISHDPSLTLAAVVRGTASVSMAEQIDDTLVRVRMRCAASLRDFAGEVAPFEKARPMLEPLLRMERQRAPRRAQIILTTIGLALLAVLIGLVSWTRIHDAAIARREMAYRVALQGEPGIVVSQVGWQDGVAQVSGFRDPLATPADTLIAARGLSPASLSMTPFASLDSRLVERRVRTALQPPPGVQISVDGHTLRLAGTAPRAWIEEARLIGRAVPGVQRLEDGALRSQEALQALHGAASPLDAIAVTFARGQSRIQPDQEPALARLADGARAALHAAADARVGACVVLEGHTDETGTEERNRQLGLERASEVRARLASMGVDEADVRVVGAGASAGPLARRVGIRLDLDEARFAPGCGVSP